MMMSGRNVFCNQLLGLLLGRPDLNQTTFDSKNVFDSEKRFDSKMRRKSFFGEAGLAGRRPAGGGKFQPPFGAKLL